MKCAIFLFGLLSFSLAEDLLLKEFATGYNQFTSNIYKQLKSKSGNLILSPLSVDVVLSLINSGARGQTAKEITAALHIPDNQTTVEKIFRTLSPKLQSNNDYDLSSANKVYVMDGFQISDQFRDTTVNAFNADIQNIDFSESTAAAAEINKWVADRTHDKIKDIMNSGLLSEITRVVLVNAIYFHGKWVNEFDESMTTKSEFFLNNNQNKTVETDFMFYYGDCEGYESENFQYLKLDYKGEDVSMHIILPKGNGGLAAIEENISDYLTPPKYKPKSVYAKIPKFKIESAISFVPILEELGVHEVFEDQADLSGINVNKGLFVSDIAQKAFIEVNEKGTTAAAASYGIIDIRTADEDKELMFFNADHPFLFYLRLNKLGINFFVGRYVSP